ncbi:MAG TPA: radical SAM protein [Proteobacteria bacterium]|nr:radical SAM protein [Pseudomonadota bacterium]
MVFSLADEPLYRNLDRYKRALADVNRVLERAGQTRGLTLSLANYQARELSPLRSADLKQAAENFSANIYYPFFKLRLAALVEENQAPVIGFSLNFLSQALPVFAMIGFCRQRWPELPLVVGGGLITSWASRPGWRNPFSGLIDHLIAGPGEEPLLALLRPASRTAFSQAEKVSPVKAGAAAFLPAGPGTKVWARPDYDDFSALPYLACGRILPYAASSGCYWNRCSFCPEKAEGHPYCPRPSAAVLGDLAAFARDGSFALLHLLDNALSPARLRALIREPPGLPWYGFARVDAELSEPDFCHGLRRAGCVMLKLGVESGDDGVLQTMGKGIGVERIARVLRNLGQAGIATYVYLLFGTPGENSAAARKTLEFTVRHAPWISFLNLAIFNLPLYSRESLALEVRDFYAGDLSLYGDFVHPLGWGRQAVRAFLDGEFRRHPAIAPILRRDPPFFSSNHAPFFTPALRF